MSSNLLCTYSVTETPSHVEECEKWERVCPCGKSAGEWEQGETRVSWDGRARVSLLLQTANRVSCEVVSGLEFRVPQGFFLRARTPYDDEWLKVLHQIIFFVCIGGF